MLTGVGCDLIEIMRVKKACEKEAFLSRVYTEEERRQAVAKAIGTGFRGFTPREIEVLRDGMGRPYVNLIGPAEKAAKERGITRIEVSISDTKEYAMAFAVGTGGQP